MDIQAIRLLVRQKLQDGRLPHDRAGRFWARPGTGEVCDACESPIAKDQMAIEGFVPRTTDAQPHQAHASCYQIWDVERGRPPNEDRREGERTTLGDVLFANRAKAPVSEVVWVGLVQAIAAGDQRALHTLYTQTHRIVFTLIMRIVSRRETAEELTVDVFHDVWRRAPTYDSAGGSVVGWLMNQARSRAIDRLRFEQRGKRVNDSAGREQGRLLRQALEALTPQERQAIETAFFSELTYSEVAARLNRALGTVKTRIRSGLEKLRQARGGTSKGP